MNMARQESRFRRGGFCVLALALAGFSIPGCGAGISADRAAVKGTVTFNGQPIKKGRINFVPAEDNKGPASGGVILDGKYDSPAEMGVAVGKNMVEIRAPEETGKKTKNPYGDDEIPEVTEVIPDSYNLATTLEANIETGKDNEANFELTGKRPRR